MKNSGGAGVEVTKVEQMTNLAEYPLFSGIRPQDIATMLSCLRARRQPFAKGAYLLLEGEDVRCIGAVLSGQVHMLKEDLNGELTILAVIRARGLFGESFVCGSRRATTVCFQAAADTETLLLPFDRVLHVCSNACIFHQRLLENMIRMIADKNMQLMEKAEIVSKKTLRGKILAYLSMQASEQGSRRIVSAINRAELADYLCANRSALSRELSAMQDEGLIEFENNVFKLL